MKKLHLLTMLMLLTVGSILQTHYHKKSNPCKNYKAAKDAYFKDRSKVNKDRLSKERDNCYPRDDRYNPYTDPIGSYGNRR